MTSVDPKPGDWVLIRAKVLDRPIPEDVTVELFSKVDQQAIRVRVDLCEVTSKPIPEEPAVGSVALVDDVAFQLNNHGGLWMVAGDDYGLSWAGLHDRGDVVVIHHA
jgi:hypothetical protein